ncbi:MAG: cytidylyltransferase domain-containing protein [Bacteroidota bacterium]
MQPKYAHLIIDAFIYARMGSSRLPGKPLMELLPGRSMLSIIFERLQRVRVTEGVQLRLKLLTSTLAHERPLIEHAQALGLEVFQGSETDVYQRTCDALNGAAETSVAFFRINGDSPFTPFDLMTMALEYFQAQPTAEIVTNLRPRTYPYGVAVELLNTLTFLNHPEFASPDAREHITRPYYQNWEAKIAKGAMVQLPTHSPAAAKCRLVVDTRQDLLSLQQLLEAHPALATAKTAALVSHCRRHPELYRGF